MKKILVGWLVVCLFWVSTALALDVPTITATVKGPNQINITWSAVTNPGWGYKVEIQSDSDSRYSTYTDLTASLRNGVGYLPYWVTESQYTDPQDASACQFPVFSLLNNTAYNFRVRTYGKTDALVETYSSYSSVSTATTRNYTIRHVRTDGNDGAGCSGANDTSNATTGAWASLHYAATRVSAGTVVYVHTGTYSADYLTSQASGTSGVDTKIVFMAHPGETVTINSGTSANFSISHNRNVLDGLAFTTTGALGGNVYTMTGNNNVLANVSVDMSTCAYSPYNSGSYNLYHNSYFHELGAPAYDQGGGDTFSCYSMTYSVIQYCNSNKGSHTTLLMATASTNNKVLNNLFDGGYGSGWHEVTYGTTPGYNLYEGNIVKDVAKLYAAVVYKPMVQISGSYSTMRRNLIYDGLSGTGVNGNTNYTTHGVELSVRTGGVGRLIYNNVFYYNGGWGIMFAAGYGNNTYDKIANNIFYFLRGGNGETSAAPTYYFMNQSTRTGVEAYNNCFLYKWAGADVPSTAMIHMYGDGGSPQTLAHQESQFPTEIYDNIETTPSFLDAANRDFHLLSTSGMIGAGVLVTDTTWGTIGETDIGAFKYYLIEGETTTGNQYGRSFSTTGGRIQ